MQSEGWRVQSVVWRVKGARCSGERSGEGGVGRESRESREDTEDERSGTRHLDSCYVVPCIPVHRI